MTTPSAQSVKVAKQLVAGWVKHWATDKPFNDPPVFPSGLIERELAAALDKQIEKDAKACKHTRNTLCLDPKYFSISDAFNEGCDECEKNIRQQGER